MVDMVGNMIQTSTEYSTFLPLDITFLRRLMRSVSQGQAAVSVPGVKMLEAEPCI